MAKLGSRNRPAVVRVQTEERAQEVLAECDAAGIQVIVGIEPDKTEDVFDIGKARKARFARPVMTARPSRNAPCPCGSGRKYKGCCGRVMAT